MIEKLQLIKQSRYESFYAYNCEERPRLVNNLPESLLGAYLEPKYKKIEKKKDKPKEKPKIMITERGPLEVLYTKEKTLLTSVSQTQIYSPDFNKSITREYLITDTKSNRNNVYDPYANQSLKRKHVFRNNSIMSMGDINKY